MDVAARVRVLEALRVADREALALQAVEYERRLEALNHAHERAAEVAHSYVTLDKYEALRTADAVALNLALTRADEKIAVLEKWRAKAVGAASVLTLFAGLIGAAVARVLGN